MNQRDSSDFFNRQPTTDNQQPLSPPDNRQPLSPPDTRRPTPNLLRLAEILIFVYAAAALAGFPAWTVDDAYISYRYAANLAYHSEFTWNVGEDPVEGYTGVLLPATLAGTMRLGVDPDRTSKTLGVLGFVVAGLALGALCRRLGVDSGVSSVAVALYAAAPMLYTHALGGLETMLFSGCAMASLVALAACLDANHTGRAEVVLFATLLLTALARPEGVVVAAVASLALLASRCAAGVQPLRATALRWGVVLVLPGLAYFVWRWSYYGQFLPNTYYAKGQRRVYEEPFWLFASFVSDYLALPVLAVAAILAAGRRDAIRKLGSMGRARTITLVVALLILLVVLAQYARTALIMNFSHRFFAPFFPFFLLSLAIVGDTMLGALGSANRTVRRLSVCAALVLVAAQIGWQIRMLGDERRFARDAARLIADEHIPAARFLAERLRDDESIVVVVDAGAVPYFSGLKTIDFGGLNDEYLSKRIFAKLTPEHLLDYFFAQRASALVFTSSAWDRLVPPDNTPYADDPRFSEYELAAKFRSSAAPDYFLFVYLRRDR